MDPISEELPRARRFFLDVCLKVMFGGAAACLVTTSSHAQDAQPSGQDAYDVAAEMSLEELLGAQTTVASSRSASVRESPGVLTVITREEILDSGARDLVDVLSLVPSIFIGVDLQGLLGAGTRGLWGHEGKILFLLDGHPLNEMSYLTTPIGGRIPVQLIERIEIIRGPGSVRYGGYAELAVVNIQTLKAEHGKRTAYTSLQGSSLTRSFGRADVNVAYSEDSVIAENLSLSFSGQFVDARPSDARYYDLYGDSFLLHKYNSTQNTTLNFGAAYKKLEIRYLFENYVAETRDQYDAIADKSYDSQFLSHNISAQYTLTPIDSLTITPRFSYVRQFPYRTVIQENTPAFLLSEEERDQLGLFSYNRLAERTTLGAQADWDVIPELRLNGGLEGRYDRAKATYYPEYEDLAGQSLYSPDDLSAGFTNLAVFAEAASENPWLNGTAGARLEVHNKFGTSFVPRVALGRVFGAFHVKALAAQAFKWPGLENLNLNPDIKAEKTTTFELEGGYQIREDLYLTANVFDLQIKRPIVYFYDGATDTEGYVNGGKTGSRGAEAELRYKVARGYAASTYSFYTARGKNDVDTYKVPGESNMLLAAPSHKLTFQGHVRVYDAWYFNTTAFLLTKRYAQVGVDADDNVIIGALDPAFVVNAGVEVRDVAMRGLAFSFYAYNLTGESFLYPQPYKGYHASIPGLAREFLLRVSYSYDDPT